LKPAIFYFQSLFRWMGFGGSAQYSGEQMSGPSSPPAGTPINTTEDAALSVSAWFGAVRLLAEIIAGMPMYVCNLKSGEWVRDEDGELQTLLQLRPNPHMTHIEFWEAVLLNLIMRGNGYAKIIRNDLGMPIALYPMAAAQVQPVVLKDGTGWYIFNLDGEQVLFGEDDVLHLKIFGNGRVGLSPLAYGARSLGIAAASDTYAATFFSRGGKPGGVLTIDRILTPKQRLELRENFKDIHEGSDQAHKLFVLEAGMKYTQVQLSPEDLQLVESRKFNVKDVLRFLGVPAFLLNESEGSTSWGTGLEQQMLGFYNLTVKPYTQRIAAGIRLKLVPLPKQRRTKIMYDYEELIAVDLVTKAKYLSQLANSGIATRNESRVKLGMPRSADRNADVLTVQSAMIPLSRAGEKPQPTVQSVPEKDE
jgi:HK97 family phage portal protein